MFDEESEHCLLWHLHPLDVDGYGLIRLVTEGLDASG